MSTSIERILRALVTVGALWGAAAPLAAAASAVDGEQLFARYVWPVFEEKCLACHGQDEEKIKGGLDLRTHAETMLGGDSLKPAIVPGKPDESPLYLATTRTHADWEAMPPKDNDKLGADQVKWIHDWIAAGAAWPEPARLAALIAEGKKNWAAADGVAVTTSGGLSELWTDRRYPADALWAYRPITRPAPPEIEKQKSEIGNPIDAFVNQQLASAKLTPAPRADARTLVRRLTYDLTGLPPAPADLAGFEAETIRDPQSAIRDLTDRLLASPHYGERQAQHWLDVTRYADTSGFSNDYERAGVWRYRDYVVRSFNGDKPFDRFILEQIAGDQLDAADPEMKVAAGFLRMGPWESTVMNSKEVVRQQFLDDVVNHVGEVFLAQPLRCAKCHDHKFDPIPTRDYYSVMAVFRDTFPAEPETPFTPAEVRPDGREERARAERAIAELNAELDVLGRKHFDAAIAWLKGNGRDTAGLNFRAGGFFNTFNTFFGSLAEDRRPPRNIGLTPDEVSRIAILSKYRSYRKRALDRYEPVAFTVYDGPDNTYRSTNERNAVPAAKAEPNPPIHILGGGGLDSPLAPVAPGVLSGPSALAGFPGKFAEHEPPRLALARWIASPRNPLTARVIVNRIWQQHFGRGLVATPNNFGRMGGRPTHPELLDFLASWFIENGWSVKALHRLVVTSETYLRSARHPDPAALRSADPDGKLYAAFPVRRLGAEEIRDTMLALTGELNPAVGGPPVLPEINLEAALQPRYVMSGVAPAYQPSPRPEDRHRRTLYAFRQRGLADPMLEVFNRPGPDLSCERRDTTTVTPQVFALFNGRDPNRRALAFARRLERAAPDTADRLRLAYELAFLRPASAAEIARAQSTFDTLLAAHRAKPIERVPLPTRVRRSMVGEMTGAVYEWDEHLDVFADGFVPDLEPWDVGPETRALAGVCLVLFNANEFLHLE
jgi:mono/diheme cytochrome c family protein